jgi:hypothetical protein
MHFYLFTFTLLFLPFNLYLFTFVPAERDFVVEFIPLKRDSSTFTFTLLLVSFILKIKICPGLPFYSLQVFWSFQ